MFFALVYDLFFFRTASLIYVSPKETDKLWSKQCRSMVIHVKDRASLFVTGGMILIQASV